MTKESKNVDVRANNVKECRQAVASISVASSPVISNDIDVVRKKTRYSNGSPTRKSKRDINSIRLSGVGRTAHTFYRRMRTLFFSNPSQEEYQRLFLHGSRRRKKSNKKNASCINLPSCISPTESTSQRTESAAVTTPVPISTFSNPEHQNTINVERATKPDEAAIYIIDNFLTDSELKYFEQKIASTSFERSFVDKLECECDEKGDDDDGEQSNIKRKNTPRDDPAFIDSAVDREKDKRQIQNGARNDGNQNNIATQMKNQNVSRVCNNETLTSTPPTKWNEGNEVDVTTKNKNGIKIRKRKRKRRTVVDDSHRTSTFYSFRKLHDTKISALEQRVANILGCWVHQIEALQLVRYLPGEFFGIHHDLGNLLEDDTVQLPRKELACKRRLVTIFCYLNTLKADEGGCTYFPKCGHLRVRPMRGRAVIWCNITPDGKADSRTIHAGEVVKFNSAEFTRRSSCTNNIIDKDSNKCKSDRTKVIESESKRFIGTEKYGLNIWVCEE